MPDSENRLLALAAVLVLGTAAQWVAWRVRFPSILLLLICGVVAGPVTGVVLPDVLLGELLFPVVSLSVAVILFESSLGLDLPDLRDIGPVLLRLLTIGALVTWMLTGLAAWAILDFGLFQSMLLGAVLVVTGPTVIGPLLRHVRPVGRVGQISRWEGIVIDPIGAVLALLVFEAYLAIGQAGIEGASWHAAAGLTRTVVWGGLSGLIAAAMAAVALRQHLIPDHLQSPVVLMLVLLSFVGANLLQEESGLLAVTIMGIVLANWKGIVLQPILEFNENLSLLLLSCLFILLAARLDLDTFAALGWSGPLFVLAMVAIVRPASVFCATAGTGTEWREKVFLCCMAPRGIVAAAVASVFALRLAGDPTPPAAPPAATAAANATAASTPAAPAGAGEGLVPATFLVIFGTVVIYGLTAAPVARRLGLATANPQGVLIAGADAVARAIATALSSAGIHVLLVDTNRWNIHAARMENLPSRHDNILSEHALGTLDLGNIGRFFGLTSNDEVNSLSAMHLAPEFGRAAVYQLTPQQRTTGGDKTPAHLRARFLFSPRLTHSELAERLERGARIKATKLTEEFTFEQFQQQYGSAAIPLFLLDGGRLTVLTTQDQASPRPGQSVLALVDVSADPGAGARAELPQAATGETAATPAR
jgi:NhaP-type Na+/H+ or K+/H+ antiporter